MSARLKLKHMKRYIARLEAANVNLRYEVSRMNRKWELIGVRQQLEAMALERIPSQYLKSVISNAARALTAKMTENLEECIAKQTPKCINPCAGTLDIRLLIPRFDETSVEVTLG